MVLFSPSPSLSIHKNDPSESGAHILEVLTHNYLPDWAQLGQGLDKNQAKTQRGRQNGLGTK